MTIQEIARMAGVSSAAVSRYLNQGSLSQEKRERIRAVIEQTDYRPSEYARALRTKRSRQIGVVVPRRRFRGFCRESVRNWIRRITISF